MEVSNSRQFMSGHSSLWMNATQHQQLKWTELNWTELNLTFSNDNSIMAWARIQWKEKKELSLSLSLSLQKKLLTPFSTQFPNTLLLPCTTITTTTIHAIMYQTKKPSNLFANFKDPKLMISFFAGLAYYQGKKDIVFRFIIEYSSSLRDFYRPLGNNNNNNNNNRSIFIWGFLKDDIFGLCWNLRLVIIEL